MAAWHQGRQGGRISNLSTQVSRLAGRGTACKHRARVQKEHGSFSHLHVSISFM